jgi:glyoxylase-like metal-dependent hydrolase (beta-lactamase superfamily II)
MKRLVAWSLVLAGLLVTSPLRAEPPWRKHEVAKLADGVYAFLWSDPLISPEPNVLIIVNDSDVVVVDSDMLPSSARMVVQEIKRLTPKPVSMVVNTHWHDDHVMGNMVFRDTWPEVHFVSHVNTRIDAARRAFGEIPQDLEKNGEMLKNLQEMVRTGKRADGSAISAAGLARMRDYAIPFLTAYQREAPTIRTVLPDLTFSDSLVLYRGSRTIELHYLGLGNTRGDAVVYLPKEKILATGDLVAYPTPFGIGSYYADWAATLERLSRIDAQTLFLGHGPIQHDETYVLQVHDLLTDLVARVGEGVKQGKTLEEVKQDVTLEDWRQKFAGDDAFKRRAFDAYFVQPAVARAYHLAKGEPDPDEDGA